jgi:hypothetical protein
VACACLVTMPHGCDRAAGSCDLHLERVGPEHSQGDGSLRHGKDRSYQLAVSRGLAEEMAGTAVTVNAVLPGPTRSEGVETFLERLAKQQGSTLAEIEAEFFRSARPR